jgi:hypothetical protein
VYSNGVGLTPSCSFVCVCGACCVSAQVCSASATGRKTWAVCLAASEVGAHAGAQRPLLHARDVLLSCIVTCTFEHSAAVAAAVCLEASPCQASCIGGRRVSHVFGTRWETAPSQSLEVMLLLSLAVHSLQASTTATAAADCTRECQTANAWCRCYIGDIQCSGSELAHSAMPGWERWPLPGLHC